MRSHDHPLEAVFIVLLLLAFPFLAVPDTSRADDAKPTALGNGLTGAKPVFPPGEEVGDVIGVRYKFRVVANESPTIKIIFGWNRFRGDGPDTYLIESNLYADGLRYDNGVQTTWPMKGRWVPKEASLRMAVPDYNKKGKTGAKTLSPAQFPRQTYLIDGIKDLWKTDLISQMDLDGKGVKVEIVRGELLKERNGWKPGGALDRDQYRKWNARATIKSERYDMAFALPEAGAKYFTATEMLHFCTEFLHTEGLFQVQFWDAAFQREGEDTWQPLNQWRVTHNDGGARGFGVRVAKHGKANVLEFSNDDRGGYLEPDSMIDLVAGKSVRGDSPERRAEAMRTMTRALEKLSVKWEQPWVDAANGIFTNPAFSDEDWAKFFADYFASHKATAKLWEYLWYPAFGWFDEATHRKLQAALNRVAKKRVPAVLEKHADDLEQFLATRLDDRADLAVWLAFLKVYEDTRDKALQDQANAKWVKQLIADYPKWLSPDAVADSAKYPWTSWLKREVSSLAK